MDTDFQDFHFGEHDYNAYLKFNMATIAFNAESESLVQKLYTGLNVVRIVLYKVCILCSDQKSKMATTTGFN